MRGALCASLFEVITSPGPETHFLPQLNRINVLGSISVSPLPHVGVVRLARGTAERSRLLVNPILSPAQW